MAEKRRFLDVWIVDTNTVYREVPYAVVTDWVQQGRLLENDQLRPSGTQQWFRLGTTPAFAAFLPRAEPFRVEDRAEALEPVEIDFAWKRPHDDEDDDVDMIPLIDISLVLLIFFMMTAAVGGGAMDFGTPQAENHLITIEPDMYWIGISGNSDETPTYFFGLGDKDAGTPQAGQAEVVRKVEEQLAGQNGPVKIRIRASRLLPYETVREMTVAMQDLKQRTRKISEVYAEVSEKENP